MTTKELMKNVPTFAAAAALVSSMMLLGPCASKDYVATATASSIATHEKRDSDFREMVRAEISEIKQDIKTLIKRECR